MSDDPSPLRDYQVAGAKFLGSRHRAILADHAGLGKTAQALTAIAKRGKGAVIICPAVAIGVWQREVRKWLGEGVKVLTQPNTKPADPPGAGEILVTTYDRALLTGHGGDWALVLDEAHALKNRKTQRFKRVKAVIERMRGPVWAMTATPILKDPEDLWGLLTVLGLEKQTYGTKTAFLSLFGGTYTYGYGVQWSRPKKGAWAPIAPFYLRRTREDHLDLPERTHEEWCFDLPKRLAARFAGIFERYPADDPQWDSWATAGELASALADLSSAKAAAAVTAIEELEPSTDRPVVVFAAHVDAAKALAKHFGWPCIVGDVATGHRTAIVDGFQAGLYAGVVATIQAGGVGITLTRAATAVFVSRSFVPALNSQAEDRVYRIGQTNNVRVIYCRANSALEDAIDKVLKRKAPYEAVQAV
jgi:superfamily II DNA or RNA helicase